MILRVLSLLLCLVALSYPANAQQDGVTSASGPVQVFIEYDINVTGTDRLHFINTLTGQTITAEVNGQQYTPFGRTVMYLDATENRVRLVLPDGRTRNHPFIQPLDSATRVDWTVAPDGKQVAWTLTERLDNDMIRTQTSVANQDGSRPRIVLTDGPRPGIRALPVAFSEDGQTLYMDYQPDSIADFTPFQQYAGLFAISTDEGGTPAMLPGEPGCFCGAGLGGDQLVRLSLTDDLSGYDVLVHHLPSGASERINALHLTGYTQAGDMVIAPDGSKAVYALAQVRDFGGPAQAVQTVFVLVNLVEKSQTPLTDPITTFVTPIAWTEDNSAIIFTSANPTLNGTWKVNLSDGRLSRVATATYLGLLP